MTSLEPLFCCFRTESPAEYVILMGKPALLQLCGATFRCEQPINQYSLGKPLISLARAHFIAGESDRAGWNALFWLL